jgi:ribosomal protein S12 methylthiotransferase accessory factor
MSTSSAVAYLGPSMKLEDARRIIEADYRRPIRRGDMTHLEPGAVVAMIDGVFDQDLAVSPREVRDAIQRGVVVFGGGSMGALRAAEVPGVIGVGRVFEWYRDGVITRDDEVALLFSESSGKALTIPSVNVRFAVDRLLRLGTIDSVKAHALISAALEIPYTERTYRAVLQSAGLSSCIDSQDLISMLQAHDLKYLDARAVLEAVDSHLQNVRTRTQVPVMVDCSYAGALSMQFCRRPGTTLIWESGDCVEHEALLEFLVYTGRAGQRAETDTQTVFTDAARRWGWISSEEAYVTVADLGLSLDTVDRTCREIAEHVSLRLDLNKVLGRLFLNDLSLKREAMRLGSLRDLARRSSREPNEEELQQAKMALCRLNEDFSFAAVQKKWALNGFGDACSQDTFLRLLARARGVALRLVESVGRSGTEVRSEWLQSCPKPTGETRFCLTPSEAENHARRIAKIIGVTRVSMIGELGCLGGVQVAQAARPSGAWSSSYGSGKSRSVAGAVTGSILEEVEKWAQEKFNPEESLVFGSYENLRGSGQYIDPSTLDLPYDSVYNSLDNLEWYPTMDLLGERTIFVPVHVLEMKSRKHDICFSRRGARKHMATNGLGCGFTREEAILHGMCEYIERHAQRIAELLLSNPGGLGPHPYRFIDLRTTSEFVQDIAVRLQQNGSVVRVLEITSEVRVPTFLATVTRETRRAEGFGTHPDPNTAMEMALLEAAQTIASATAGGREDLSIHARSLGRHERPRPVSAQSTWFWLDPDAVHSPLSSVEGFSSGDVREDILWTLGRLRAAGLDHVLVVDLTPETIKPAVVVRVIVPGLETNNPFYTGPRARTLLLRDLLPRWL